MRHLLSRYYTLELGDICVCAVVRLEMLYSAWSPHDYTKIEESLSVFRDLREAFHAAHALAATCSVIETADTAFEQVPGPSCLAL